MYGNKQPSNEIQIIMSKRTNVKNKLFSDLLLSAKITKTSHTSFNELCLCEH